MMEYPCPPFELVRYPPIGASSKLETNPRVGFAWMRKGNQRRLPTPGTNRKVWISGALNFSTGRFH
jgi:hypothetical protein